ncbi:MAG: hypothetical protein Kow00109_29850 [Acidobacteriota bacterium]
MTLLLSALVVALLYVPFLGQAYHIDDRIYLEVARNILSKPLFPYDFPAAFEGISAPDAASHTHLPLLSYYLAPWIALFGEEREWVLHLVCLPFPLLAAWSFYRLARLWTHSAAWAPVLLLAAPAFAVLSHTLMTDIPFLAFWITAMAAGVRLHSGEGGRGDWVLLAGSVLGAAFLSLLTGGLLLLLGAMLVLFPRRGAPDRRWWGIFAAPLLLWVLWYLRAYLHYDRWVLWNLATHVAERQAFDLTMFGAKALSFVLNLGAVFLFPAALWWGFRGAFRTRIAALLLFAAAVPFYLAPAPARWEALHVALFGLFFASGFLVVWEFVLLAGSRRPEDRFLALWFFGIFAAAVLVYYSGSVRYTLPALPAVLLAWLRRWEVGPLRRSARNVLLWITVATTVANAALLAVADYRFAGVYPRYARAITRFYADPAHTLWFTGEWGFRYYVTRQGGRLLLRADPSPRPGDIVVKPYVAMPWVTLIDGDRYTRLVEQIPVVDPFPIRILDFSSHAGFYSTGWGLLPYSIGTGKPWEWFNIFEVIRSYDGEVPPQPRYY